MGLFSSKKPNNQASLPGFTPAQFILDNWDIQRTRDRPGVYTILIFDDEKTIGPNSYTSAYAGQSMNVYRRLHNHLTGKGNGDVYADFRNGKCVMIKVELCDPDFLNDLEKERISELDPKRRYNISSGGGTTRDEIGLAVKSIRCRVTIVRVSSLFDGGLTPKVFFDNKELGKFDCGRKKTITTTEGFHMIEIKQLLSKHSEKIDLKEGDVVEIKATFTSWSIKIKK